MESLLKFVQRFGVVSPHDESVLRHYAKRSNLHAGEYFLHPGQICHKVGFITKGVFRVYVHTEEGKVITRGFPSEGNFMVDLESFYNEKPTNEFWEAITDLEFLYWERTDITRMESEIGSWQTILIPMTQHILVKESHERTEMFNDDASTRYSKFLARYPHIVSRVPLRFIANFLGIAPQSLSRIRQKFSKS